MQQKPQAGELRDVLWHMCSWRGCLDKAVRREDTALTFPGRTTLISAIPQTCAGIFIPAPPPGQAFFIVCVAGVIASVVDNPVRRAVRRWLKIGGENKVISSWDNLSK